VSVATTIRDQIGHKALYMMGAKNLIDHGSESPGGLSFKIGRNVGRVTHIRISLTDDDLYTVEFIRISRAPDYHREILSTHEGIYFDQLCDLIGAVTGMTLTMGTMGDPERLRELGLPV